MSATAHAVSVMAPQLMKMSQKELDELFAKVAGDIPDGDCQGHRHHCTWHCHNSNPGQAGCTCLAGREGLRCCKHGTVINKILLQAPTLSPRKSTKTRAGTTARSASSLTIPRPR